MTVGYNNLMSRTKESEAFSSNMFSMNYENRQIKIYVVQNNSRIFVTYINKYIIHKLKDIQISYILMNTIILLVRNTKNVLFTINK
jgi:hypothetical protein